MKGLEKVSDLIILGSADYSTISVQSELIFSRIAQENTVFYFQPPQPIAGDLAAYSIEINTHGISVIRPYLPQEVSVYERMEMHKAIIHQLMANENIYSYSVWLDSPKNVPLIRYMCPTSVIHQWNSELNGRYPELEEELQQYTDISMGPRKISEAALDASGVVNVWDKSIHHDGIHL
jgi:hypothetical protein